MHPSLARRRRAGGRRGVAAVGIGALAVSMTVFLSSAVVAGVSAANGHFLGKVHPPAFVTTTPRAGRGISTTTVAFTSSDGAEDEQASDEEDDGGLSWRLAKVRLEEANTRRFLKSRPIKLPYADSQKWIQLNWAPKTQQEFEDLVANGNLRTPYISKRPEEYYGRRGEWISWDHYLLGEESESVNGTDSKWQ